MSTPPRRPRAIRLDELEVVPRELAAPVEPDEPARLPRAVAPEAVLIEVPDEAANGWSEAEPLPRPKRRFHWLGMLLAGLGGLVTLAFGLWVDGLVAELFARSPAFGWLGVGLVGLFVAAALAIAVRESIGLARVRTIDSLRSSAEAAHASNDAAAARAVVGQLLTLYADRPDMARGRTGMAGHVEQIMDGRDLLDLAERDLLTGLDERATAFVLGSAQRVSVVTAVSPRALIDLAIVLIENLRLVRAISELYGGRPGALGSWRLVGNVLAHLAATGAIAAGDGLLQQVVGHGLAAKLSARLGEGIVNGMLTARIGLAAIDVCRPLPFKARPKPGLGSIIASLTRMSRPTPGS